MRKYFGLMHVCVLYILIFTMVKHCCIENCKLSADERGCSNLSYFKVPKDQVRKKEWENSINNHFKSEKILGPYEYLCSLHFNDDCFNVYGMGQRVTLKKTAVPTIFVYGNQGSSQQNISTEAISNNIEKKSTCSKVFEYESPESRYDTSSIEASCDQNKRCKIESQDIFQKENDSENYFERVQNEIMEQSSNHNLLDSSFLFKSNEILDDIMNPSSSKDPMILDDQSKKTLDQTMTVSEKTFTKSLVNIDLDSVDLDDKALVLRLLKEAQKEIEDLRKSCKAKNARLYRSRKRVKNFGSLLIHLKKRGLVTEKASKALDDAVSEEAQTIFTRLLETRKRNRTFPSSLQKFATTLHFYSPKAYNYLRNIFLKRLPHPLTISKWYRRIKCTSGINQASIEVLKARVKQMKKVNGGKPILCNLVMDEMDIKEKIEIVSDRECGYIDRGTNVDAVPTPAATNVLVTMVVCENGKFKIPISYHFITGLSGPEKAKIINENLRALHETDITETSVTFDGLKANFSMCTALGAQMSSNKPDEQFFLHPLTKENVYLMFDGCHALKLVRNVPASGNNMYDSTGNLISWSYIEKLIDFQTEQQLSPANKLTEEHKRWEENKMNVRIAAQTLSHSVHDSLMYMRDDLKLQEFANAEGTAKFCSMIDNAFDIFNSRQLYSKNEFKEGISQSNFEKVNAKVKEITTYIKGLRFANGESVVNSSKKTGFEGLILSLQNVINIYKKYFEPHNLYLLTYKLSQDHLEVFFSAVRSAGGNNNNPTCHQFCTAFKKLLTHADIKGSSKGNCVTIDDTELLCIPINTWSSLNDSIVRLIQTTAEGRLNSEKINFDDDNFYGTNKKYIDDIVGHIAGSVTRKILIRTKCYSCPLVLTDEISHSALSERKNRGGLIKPSLEIIRTCQLLEQIFRAEYKSKRGIFRDMCLRMSSMVPDDLLPIEHSENPSEHRSQLLKNIIVKYFQLRSKKFEYIKCQQKKRVRRKLTKLILHCHD